MTERVPDIGIHPTLPVVLRDAAERFGERDLLVLEDDRLTFVEAERRSRLLARRLLEAGVGKGTRVGMQFPYGTDFVVAWLAVGRIGALIVPLSTAYTPYEVGSAVKRGDVDLLLSPPTLLGRDQSRFLSEAVEGLEGIPADGLRLPSMPFLRRVWAIEGDEPGAPMVSEEMLEAVEAEVFPADWLVLIQTSGSTAEPKGVLHTHGAVLRRTGLTREAATGGLNGTVIFLAMPFFWVGGVLMLGAALQGGTTLLVQDRFNPAEALDLIERERASGVAGWLSLLPILRAHPSIPDRDLESIPMLTAPPDPSGRPPSYLTGLGMTESMGPHTGPSEEHGLDLPDHLRGSLGATAPFYEHRLLDPETGVVIEGDGEGELCIRGMAVTVGMYKREREEVFDPDGWFHTGDRVARREGLFYFTGRTTEMIKTAGSNVAPPEVEKAVESLPGVRHAFVVGIPHPVHEQQVAAIVVPAEGTTLDPDDLRARVATMLSSYKVPRVVLVLPNDDIPWLGTGKPDKLTMRAMLEKEAVTRADR